MKDRGRRLAQKMNAITSEKFAVIGEAFFSLLYDLNVRAKKRREKDMIPVKECERNEKKDKATIKNLVLESLESRFFIMKYNE